MRQKKSQRKTRESKTRESKTRRREKVGSETSGPKKDDVRKGELLARNYDVNQLSRTQLKKLWRERHCSGDIGIFPTDVFRLIMSNIIIDNDVNSIKALKGVSRWFWRQLRGLVFGISIVDKSVHIVEASKPFNTMIKYHEHLHSVSNQPKKYHKCYYNPDTDEHYLQCKRYYYLPRRQKH